MRNHKNWLETYLRYVEDTEPETVLHIWCGLSALAAALQRKVKFKLGRVETWPSMYVFLVAPPAARKGEAIREVAGILQDIKTIKLSPTSMTMQSLEDTMVDAQQDSMFNGKRFTHCSLTAIISELKSFTKSKKQNGDFITLLTDIFDYPMPDHISTTRTSKNAFITEPFLNILAATTPSDLGEIISTSAIGGGFTSRVIYIYVDKKKKKIPKPVWGEEQKRLKVTLTEDLKQIANISGVFEFDTDAFKFYSDWYVHRSDIHICYDPAFAYWYERKQIFIMKVSMLLAVSRGETKFIRLQDVKKAFEYIEATEHQMHNCFAMVGRSGVTEQSKLVLDVVKARTPLPEVELRRIIMKDLGDERVFEAVVGYLVNAGMINKVVKNPGSGIKGVSYTFVGNK